MAFDLMAGSLVVAVAIVAVVVDLYFLARIRHYQLGTPEIDGSDRFCLGIHS